MKRPCSSAGTVQADPVTSCGSLGSAISAAGPGGTVQISGVLVCSSQISITTSVTLVGSSADVDGFDGQSTTALFSVTGSGVQVNIQFLQLKNAKVRN
jgi:hypothetical protein